MGTLGSWLFGGFVVFAVLAVDLFFSGESRDKADAKNSAAAAEKLASVSDTFEGQLEYA